MTIQYKAQQTIIFKKKPVIIGSYSLASKKEKNGHFVSYYDEVVDDDMFGQKTFEKAEKTMLLDIIRKAIKKAKMNEDGIDLLLCGDLLNQIVASSLAARELNTSFIGLYGACSTMAESIAIASCMIEGGHFHTVACATASHFSSSERQYRFPLELGNQRPPMSQWTVTGGGCSIISDEGEGHCISSATFGKVEDYDMHDPNNMGAAMAPAAYSTMCAHFKNTNTTPEDYDLIVTGDLGKHGSEILRDLMEKEGYILGENYGDCGHMIFKKSQKVLQGGSGSGCCASILNSYIYSKLDSGEIKNVLFVATGALLSSTSTQQGESIPCIAHAIVIEKGK